MEVIELATGLRRNVFVSPVSEKDFKVLTKKRFFFDWRACSADASIYKLHLEEDKDILGVMGLKDIPAEKRIEIKLLASAAENQGKKKKFDRVAGSLIAFACQKADTLYGEEAFISLVPKTKLINHYIQKYYMKPAGFQLFLDGINLKNLINDYSA